MCLCGALLRYKSFKLKWSIKSFALQCVRNVCTTIWLYVHSHNTYITNWIYSKVCEWNFVCFAIKFIDIFEMIYFLRPNNLCVHRVCAFVKSSVFCLHSKICRKIIQPFFFSFCTQSETTQLIDDSFMYGAQRLWSRRIPV